jgi:hypothetical protein
MAKQKKVPYDIIADQREEPWEILREQVKDHRPDMEHCQFAMAWRKNLKADKDDVIVLGGTKIFSDLDRELGQPDVLIVLNKEHYAIFDRFQRAALIDHFLQRAALVKNKDGSIKTTEKGQICYRKRKPDVVEFNDVIERHGCYLRSLEIFAEKTRGIKATPLFPPEVMDPPDEGPANGEATHERHGSAKPRSPRSRKKSHA